jgi:hypothetical protein
MCVWCGFPYSEVVDYASGNTVCTNCGTVLDRDFSMMFHENTSFDGCNEAIFSNEEMVRDRKDGTIWTHLNVRCTFELCMSRKDTAKVRKTYNDILREYPHLVFLHRQEDVISAILWLLFPTEYKKQEYRLTPIVQKIANKLKDQCSLF